MTCLSCVHWQPADCAVLQACGLGRCAAVPGLFAGFNLKTCPAAAFVAADDVAVMQRYLVVQKNFLKRALKP